MAFAVIFFSPFYFILFYLLINLKLNIWTMRGEPPIKINVSRVQAALYVPQTRKFADGRSLLKHECANNVKYLRVDSLGRQIPDKSLLVCVQFKIFQDRYCAAAFYCDSEFCSHT